MWPKFFLTEVQSHCIMLQINTLIKNPIHSHIFAAAYYKFTNETKTECICTKEHNTVLCKGLRPLCKKSIALFRFLRLFSILSIKKIKTI